MPLWQRWKRRVQIATACSVLVGNVVAAEAQKATTPVMPTPSSSASTSTINRLPGYGDSPETEMDARREYSLAKARENERRKRMVDDANRLVVLAARYRASVSEHGAPTPEDSRLLQDMEKLARSVKDRMRGQ